MGLKKIKFKLVVIYFIPYLYKWRLIYLYQNFRDLNPTVSDTLLLFKSLSQNRISTNPNFTIPYCWALKWKSRSYVSFSKLQFPFIIHCSSFKKKINFLFFLFCILPVCSFASQCFMFSNFHGFTLSLIFYQYIMNWVFAERRNYVFLNLALSFCCWSSVKEYVIFFIFETLTNFIQWWCTCFAFICLLSNSLAQNFVVWLWI
jgi:hypothetical protein